MSREHAGLEEILDRFLSTRTRRGIATSKGKLRLAAAAFGIAGPVIGGRSATTNLPWVVDQRTLARRLKIRVALVNDLEATAHAIPALPRSALAVLNQGRPVRGGNLVLIAAGTGLGEAFVLQPNGRFLPVATEGGHSDYAPGTAEQTDLLGFLRQRFGHVSVERVLSGPGLVNVYEFLSATRPDLEPVPGLVESAKDRVPAALEIEIDSKRSTAMPDAAHASTTVDSAHAISAAALDGSSRRAAEALRIFVSAYGAEASNLALKVLAVGGVYIGGGIAPKILPALQDGAFMQALLDKGRFRSLLEAMPVKVILDDRAALLGAARVAAGLVSSR